jgi:regulatory protein regA2
MSLAENVRILRERAGMTQAELAEKLGKGQTTIFKIENGQTLRPRFMDELAQALGVTRIQLEFGTPDASPAPQPTTGESVPALVTPMEPGVGYNNVPTPLHKPDSNIGNPGRYRTWSSNDPLPSDEFSYIRFKKEVVFRGGAGSVEMEDYNDYKLPFAKATLHRLGVTPDRAMCFTVEGDSMVPVLPPGAMIGVNFDDTRIKDGQIYAFRHDDLFRVKILYRLPGGQVKISSYNSVEYPDEFVSIEDIIIIGRVFTWSVLN